MTSLELPLDVTVELGCLAPLFDTSRAIELGGPSLHITSLSTAKIDSSEMLIQKL
jgi:hypothetical protein